MMNKSLTTLIILGLILPIIYTKGTKKQTAISNAEESLDSLDFWDFNPNEDSSSETTQKEVISTKKVASSQAKKSTMNELEQLLKDVEDALANIGTQPAARHPKRALGMSVTEVIINEEEIMVEVSNNEFDLNTEAGGSTGTDSQDEQGTQEGGSTQQDETQPETNDQTSTQPDEETPEKEEEDNDFSPSQDELDGQTTTNDESQSRMGESGTAILSGMIEYEMEFSGFNQQEGRQTFINALAEVTGVDPRDINIVNIREGSVIFEFEIILPASDDQTKQDSLNKLAYYASKIEDATKDYSLGFNVPVLKFTHNTATFAPSVVYTTPKDDSLVAVLVAISATVILGAIGWFVYKNKQAEGDMKPASKQTKYQYPGKVDSQTERLDIESKGSSSASAVGDEIINDKIKLFPNSPPSDSSL